jgi:hypothetical protein
MQVILAFKADVRTDAGRDAQLLTNLRQIG